LGKFATFWAKTGVHHHHHHTNLVISTSFSLKSLGHSPAREKDFFGGLSKRAVFG
jgi:hypothetical protein